MNIKLYVKNPATGFCLNHESYAFIVVVIYFLNTKEQVVMIMGINKAIRSKPHDFLLQSCFNVCIAVRLLEREFSS